MKNMFRTSKKKKPLISIIVASYNCQDFISETLGSLVCQTYKNFEVIVVDDGSTDDSVRIIEKYSGQYKNISLYTHKNHVNKGLLKTLQLGLSKSKGKWVAFCESDDFWATTHLEEKVKIIKRYPHSKIIVNNVEIFGDEPRKRIMIAYHTKLCLPYFSQTKNKISVLDYRITNRIPTFSCCMVKKDIIEKCDFNSSVLNATLDWHLWRQICAVYPVYFVNKKLTFWRSRGYSQTLSAELDSIRYRELQRKVGDSLLLKRHPWKARSLRKYDIKTYKKVPYFSVIMPTYNRAFCICDAIDSLLRQTYQNFELIIVDDGSTDNTGALIRERYSKELASGKIRYSYKEHAGATNMRNYALDHAKYDWIAYMDSDNELVACALEIFALNICNYPRYSTFYAQIYTIFGKNFFGKPFDYESLLKSNFIDMGVFVHKRKLYQELGGFDTNLKRLEDWDLILKYTKKYPPKFIDAILLLYNDSDKIERITNTVDFKSMFEYIRKKYTPKNPSNKG